MRQGQQVILLVEDNIDAQEVTTAVLRRRGYEVIQAADLEQARMCARKRTPDVIVLDSRLPDGDGLELASEWQLDTAMKRVPIIMLTAFSARQDMEAALLAGVDGFLVKPCPAAVLAAQIERVLMGCRPSQTLRAHRV